MAQRNYNGERFRTITKAELIEALEDLNDDDLVIFSTEYGDYSRTVQALPLRGEVEEVRIGKTAYSNSGFEVVTDPDVDEEGFAEDEDGEEMPKYYVIR